MVPATDFPEPEVLEDFTPIDRSKTPWRSFADGRVRRFKKGVHYKTAGGSFRQAAAKWGEKFGCDVEGRTLTEDGQEYVELKITPRGAGPSRSARARNAGKQQQLNT